MSHPVACIYKGYLYWTHEFPKGVPANSVPLFADDLAMERNFCQRCGKRTADPTVIHTCTPPQERNT